MQREDKPVPPRRTERAWPRRALLGLFALVLALLAATVVARWERLVSDLTNAPAPSSSLVAPREVASAGEGAVGPGEARP